MAKSKQREETFARRQKSKTANPARTIHALLEEQREFNQSIDSAIHALLGQAVLAGRKEYEYENQVKDNEDQEQNQRETERDRSPQGSLLIKTL